MERTVVVEVRGGIAQAVASDGPVHVIFVDYDTDGVDEAALVRVDGERVPVYCGQLERETNRALLEEVEAVHSAEQG